MVRRLAFRSVDIRRMPGFDRSGFEVRELSPGINLIYGPNGSGKSTLARGIRHLLSPRQGAPERASIRGVIDLDGIAYLVEIDAGLTRCIHAVESTDAVYPAQAPEVVRRHAIALLDLARSDEDLAAQVAREMAGGFDIPRARDALGFADKTYTRNQGRVGEHEKARADYEEARRLQEALSGDEDDLARFREELERARSAVEQKARLDLALRRVEAAGAVEDARAALASYAEGIDRVSESSLSDLNQQRAHLEETRRAIDAETTRRADARRRALDCGFPAGTKPAAVEDTEQALQAVLKQINGIDAARERLTADLADRQSRRNEAARMIGPSVKPEAVAALDAEAVSKLFDFARKAAAVHSRRESLGSLREWLIAAQERSSPGAEDLDPEAIRGAVMVLERWLAANEAEGRSPRRRSDWATLAGTIGLVLVGLALAILAHPAWLIAAVAGGACWRSGSSNRVARRSTSAGDCVRSTKAAVWRARGAGLKATSERC